MSNFYCDGDVISAFTPCDAVQIFTADEQNLQDLRFNMFT